MMKITKFGHSCLLVEVAGPIRRSALFDPGIFSELPVDLLSRLDYVIITHEHPDHIDLQLLKNIVAKFPNVQIKVPDTLVAELLKAGIPTGEVGGVKVFKAPHEGHKPFLSPPDNLGIHYLDLLTNPGDSHSFTQSKAVLVLPITAPWGSTDAAVQLALKLKPKHILPVHDWHWKDQVRVQMYDRLEELFKGQGITFHKLKNGQPVVIDV